MAIYTISAVLIMIACFLLILIVLVQNSKGGGLTSNFSSSNQMMGVRKTTDFLEKATWTLAISVLVLSVICSLTIHQPKQAENIKETRLKKQIENINPSVFNPSFPTTAPPPVSTNEEKPK